MNIVLYQFPPMFGVDNPSPFCLKVEAWLKLAGLPFSIHHTIAPNRAPKGKLPYIRLDDQCVCDSDTIIATLAARSGIHLDNALDAREAAELHALVRMLEHHYYWAMVWSRWVGPNWALTRAEISQAMPFGVRHIVPKIIHRQIRRDLHGQGLGRLGEAEIYRRANQDMAAASDYLGDRPYLGGAQPVTADAAFYGLIANALGQNQPGPLVDFARTRSNLVSYAARMRKRLSQAAETAAAI